MSSKNFKSNLAVSSAPLAGMSRRQFLKAAAVAGAGLALSRYQPALAQGKPSGSINYWHHFTSDSEFKGLEKVMELFAKKYPDVKLVQENIPNADFMSKITAAIAANSRPDTTMVASERFADLLGMNGLLDISDRVKNWELKKYFPDNRWQDVTVDGKIYGIPAFTFVDWMYYRKDWFDEAGLKVPTTFQEFQDAAIKLTDKSKNRYGFGLRAGGGGQDMIVGVIEAFGSPIIADGKAAMDKAKTIEAVRWYSDLFTKYKVTPPSAPNDSYRQIMEGFKTGQTAMIWHHTGSLAELQGALKDTQFMSAVRPKGPVTYPSYLSYLFNGIMKSDNIEAAWAWISFWGENDPTIAFLQETGYFPASAAVAEDKRISDNPYYVAATDTLKIGRLIPKFAGYDGWASGVVLPAFQKILVGSATVEQAVDEMMSGLDKALA